MKEFCGFCKKEIDDYIYDEHKPKCKEIWTNKKLTPVEKKMLEDGLIL